MIRISLLFLCSEPIPDEIHRWLDTHHGKLTRLALDGTEANAEMWVGAADFQDDDFLDFMEVLGGAHWVFYDGVQFFLKPRGHSLWVTPSQDSGLTRSQKLLAFRELTRSARG